MGLFERPVDHVELERGEEGEDHEQGESEAQFGLLGKTVHHVRALAVRCHLKRVLRVYPIPTGLKDT